MRPTYPPWVGWRGLPAAGARSDGFPRLAPREIDAGAQFSRASDTMQEGHPTNGGGPKRAARLLTAGVSLWAAGGAALAQPGSASAPPAVHVVVDAAREETLEAMREVVGELRAVKRSVLASQRAGLVVEVRVEASDSVADGDVLVRLDDSIARLDVERASAEVDQRAAVVDERNAALAKAQRDEQRLAELTRRAAASENELKDAQTTLAEAQARLAQARADLAAAAADLALARERLSDMVVKAPFAGAVVEKRIEVGQWAGEGQGVIDLVALDPIDAWLSAPQALAARLLRDPSATIQVRDEASGELHESSELRVAPVADPLSRNVGVRVRLPNPDGALRPGMSVLGLLPEGRSEPALTVHKDAILRNDAGPFVYVVRGGVAVPVRVQKLFAAGDRVAVRAEGLSDGALVIVEGNERLFPGQSVSPQPLDRPAARAEAGPNAAPSRTGGGE